MEYVLIVIILLQGGYIFYSFNKKPKPLTEEEKMKLRREKIEENWQKLFNYNETIATRGYKDE